MTIDDFLTELTRHIPRNVWRIDTDGLLRATSDGCIYRYCPITALAYWRDGEDYETARYMEAADLLGIDRGLAFRIAKAADGDAGFNVQVRSDLVHATIFSNKPLPRQLSVVETVTNE